MRTLIEASPDGWWYTSLISHNPNTRIVVFHTLPSHPAAKSSRRSEGFLERLHDSTTHISSIISKWDYVIQGGHPHCTAAGSSHLEKICEAAENWVAVGDAAMAFDPLSSQGIMTALEMGIYIGLKLAHHMENEGTDADFDQNVRVSYMQVLREYQKHRAYYYSIVKRFPGEMFWENIVGT
jgi:2-polyprenyl-6-methoxyphenol hydroxylase-like FAD-dependent oxidoreductase